jgi:hypothetical protein
MGDPPSSRAPERPTSELQPPLIGEPGQGPFHIKGLAFEGLFAYVAQKVPDGKARAFERIADPRVRAYLQQPFLAASRYDIVAYLHMVSAAAGAAGVPAARFLAEQSAWQAARDVGGVYRLLLKVTSPETVAQRLGLAWARYFDFAKIDVLSVTPGCVVLHVRQMPTVLVPWYRIGARSAGDTIIALAGATAIEVAFTVPQPDGTASGFALCHFELRRTWRR